MTLQIALLVSSDSHAKEIRSGSKDRNFGKIFIFFFAKVGNFHTQKKSTMVTSEI